MIAEYCVTKACALLAVGLYSEHTKGPIMLLTALDSGVTHMVFTADGNLLYTGFRKVYARTVDQTEYTTS